MNAPDAGVDTDLRRITTALVSRIAPSPTNPRKHFDDAALAELTASVLQHGVLQPILLRPWPADYAYQGSRPTFEIVAGERRWRAAKAANEAWINVVVRDLSTREVLEMQIVENLQRADLHPLEEAEGYARMAQEHGYTVEDLAEKIGKSKAYIYARMKLVDLTEEGRKAFFDGELTASTALLIARIPTHKLQVQALQEVLLEGHRDGGQPMSARDVKHFLAHRYQMDLAKAPFARDDRTLVPTAGACSDCPKRSGVQPEIWDDASSADVCTDTTCFADKKAAQQQRTIAEARARGIPVITGEEAQKVHISHTHHVGDYVSLDAIHYADNERRTYRELLGDGIEKTLVEDRYRGGLIETVALSVLTEKLIEAGLIDDEARDKTSNTKKAKELEKKVAEENAYRQELKLRIETEIERLIPPAPLPAAIETLLVPLLRLAVTRLAKLTGYFQLEHIANAWKSPGKNKTERMENLVDSIQGLPLSSLAAMAIDLTVIDVIRAQEFTVDKPPEVMLEAARILGIDPDEVRRQTLDRLQFAQPDAAGRSVKYRHPSLQSMTWSGRGKPPAWVKVWLEQGKTLEDLLVEKAAEPMDKAHEGLPTDDDLCRPKMQVGDAVIVKNTAYKCKGRTGTIERKNEIASGPPGKEDYWYVLLQPAGRSIERRELFSAKHLSLLSEQAKHDLMVSS